MSIGWHVFNFVGYSIIMAFFKVIIPFGVLRFPVIVNMASPLWFFFFFSHCLFKWSIKVHGCISLLIGNVQVKLSVFFCFSCSNWVCSNGNFLPIYCFPVFFNHCLHQCYRGTCCTGLVSAIYRFWFCPCFWFNRFSSVVIFLPSPLQPSIAATKVTVQIGLSIIYFIIKIFFGKSKNQTKDAGYIFYQSCFLFDKCIRLSFVKQMASLMKCRIFFFTWIIFLSCK